MLLMSRCPRSEVWSPKSEIRSPRSEVGNQFLDMLWFHMIIPSKRTSWNNGILAYYSHCASSQKTTKSIRQPWKS